MRYAVCLSIFSPFCAHAAVKLRLRFPDDGVCLGDEHAVFAQVLLQK